MTSLPFKIAFFPPQAKVPTDAQLPGQEMSSLIKILKLYFTLNQRKSMFALEDTPHLPLCKDSPEDQGRGGNHSNTQPHSVLFQLRTGTFAALVPSPIDHAYPVFLLSSKSQKNLKRKKKRKKYITGCHVSSEERKLCDKTIKCSTRLYETVIFF